MSGLASSKGLELRPGLLTDDDTKLRIDPRNINEGADNMCDRAETDQFDARMCH